jgi:hypothetical protein
MKRILKTPQESLTFLILTFLFYVTSPIFEWLSLKHDLMDGKFASNADSIGIGITQFIFCLIIFAPFTGIFTLWIMWKYPPKVSLFGYNERRPFWSFIWTLIFGFLFLNSFIYGFIKTVEGNFAETIKTFFICYLCLVFRASIIFRKGES